MQDGELDKLTVPYYVNPVDDVDTKPQCFATVDFRDHFYAFGSPPHLNSRTSATHPASRTSESRICSARIWSTTLAA